MSEPLPITSNAPRRRSPSRQGRLGTVSPSNSFDPAFAPPSRHTSLLSPDSPDISLSSTPPEERRTVCAQEVSRRLRTLSSTNPSKPLEILHLPPLLSLLPSNHPLPDLIPSDVAYTSSSLPTITPLSLSLHRALHQLRPITSNYAIAPYADSFNWSDLELEDLTEGQITREREWYIVAFRSKRRKGFSEEERKRLYSADREAHEEAIQAGGLLCYWFGSPISSAPTSESSSQDEDLVGRNLATCIWESRASALLAMRGEKHKVAAQLASRSYERYTLERYLLRKQAGSTRVRVSEWEGRDVRGIED
ncbi:hypothetical protein JCM5353_003883 [Sporobolomyces roseus]